MPDWWYDNDIHRRLQAFHDRHARQPNLVKIRPYHDDIIRKIRNELQKENKCQTLIYTGSAYEGVQIDGNYDFDVTFVMDGSGLEIVESAESAEHVYLKAKTGFFWGVDKRYERLIDTYRDREIIPDKLISEFFSSLQKIIDRRGFNITLRRHGPAVQMDVHSPHGTYSVDMVPSFEVGGGFLSKSRHFVAKPIKGYWDILWRESFAREESQFFRGLSKGNCCHKKVIRIMKAIRVNEANLHSLTSYHFKTALMYVCENRSSTYDWNERNLVVRLMDVLGYLEDALQKKYLGHKFMNGRVNLFANINEDNLQNMYHRIRRIRNCEHIFRNITADRSSTYQHDSNSCSNCQETSWCVIM